MSWIFQSDKMKKFLTAPKNILTLLRLEKTSVGVGQPSPGHKKEGTGEGEEDV
jgi:hypothetical protein